MKKKILTKVSKLMALFAVAVMIAACSDGSHKTPGDLINPGTVEKPAITKFTISKADGSGAGSSVTVSAGESVLLEWEVTTQGAAAEVEGSAEVAPKADEAKEDEAKDGEDTPATGPSITIESKALGLQLKDLPAIGNKVVENVTVDAIFVLSASNGTKFDMRDVSVTIANTDLVVSLTADPAEIKTAESSNLCWEISRGDAKFTVSDEEGNILATTVVPEEVEVLDAATEEKGDEVVATGKAVYSEGEEESGEEQDIVEEGEAAEVAISDCVAVSPTKTTKYSINVTAPGTEAVVKDATVTVLEGVVIEKFSVSPDKVNAEDTVTLSWKVTPANAVVEIAPMFDGKTFEAEGVAEAKVSATTQFTLTAYMKEKKDKAVTKSVSVNIQERGALTLKTDGDQVIFVGEKAKISWEVTDAKGLTVNNAQVYVSGGSFGEAGSAQAGKGSVEVSPTETTEYIISALALRPQVVKVVVRSWEGPGSDASKVTTAVGVSKADTSIVYSGFSGKLFDMKGADGKDVKGFHISRGVNNGSRWTSLDLPFMAVYPKLDPQAAGNNVEMFSELEYPVNAIVAGEDDAKRIYVATAGGVFYSDDEGKNWSILIASLLNNDISFPHASCKGKELNGWSNKKDISGLSQACDVAIASDGRVIVASDMAVTYLPEGADKTKGSSWKGAKSAVYGLVNHDLEIAKLGDKEVLYVGSSKGLYVSLDMGEKYGAVNEAGAPTGDVFSVEVDEKNNKLFAASGNKVYTCTLDGYYCSGWSNKTVSDDAKAVVYSIANDSVKEGALFVGTGKGVFYSADSGSSFKDVTGGVIDRGVAVMSVASAKSESGRTGSVYLGTSEGVFVTTSDVAKGGRAAKVAEEDKKDNTEQPATPPPPSKGATDVMRDFQ